MSSAGSAQAFLLAEEYFSAEDERFVDALREVDDPRRLAQLADLWKRDTREWAREQKIKYLRMAPDCVGHQPVVKRLFKQAQEDADDRVVAACAALFDRLVRHTRRTRYRWDWRSRSSWQEEYLAPSAPKLPNDLEDREVVNPWTGEKMNIGPAPMHWNAVYFSYRTRYYLQRRAWRYFRRLFHQGGDRYRAAVKHVLMEYRDEDLDSGERLLDCWTLMQIAFREHPALRFGRERVRLAQGGRLSELTAAPYFLGVWLSADAFPPLVDLMRDSPSRLVRVWAMQLVERAHADSAAQLPVETLLELLFSDDQDMLRFAAGLLKDNRAFGALPLESWLKLLDEAGPAALETVCTAMRHHNIASRLSLAECVGLATREPAPVAQLALAELKARQIVTEEEHDHVARLADAECAALAGELADWALGVVGSQQEYDRDHVSRFFDSLSADVRESAWKWLDAADCPGRDDPVLFCRLLETPYHDLKLRVVDLLERRSLPGEAAPGLTPIWTAVLVGIHRGGRQKLRASRQLAEALSREPSRADEVLPILAAAVRSVRRPESRAALSAVVGSLTVEPTLSEAVGRWLPELEVLAVEADA